ncbi:unnamed protein product [Rhodiola kirilowii]
MAEIALACLLGKLESLRPEEVAVLKKMDADVFSIKAELEELQHLQRQTDVVEENSLELEIFVKDLREAAQESEDAVDNFLFHLANLRSYSEAGGSRMYAFVKRFLMLTRNSAAPNSPGSGGYLKRFSNRWFPSKDIYSPLREIKPKFLKIIEKNQKLEFTEEGDSYPSTSRYKYQEDALFLEEADLVGIAEPKKKLIKLLVNSDDAELRVIPVVGMAGLGKTALVKNIYDDIKVKMHFKSHAWISVCQTFKIEELLIDLIQQLYGENRSLVPPDIDSMNVKELIKQIQTLLNRTRYLVVLDDVWSIDVWISIKIAFPGNNKSSRVMLTTNRADVAFSSSQSAAYIYNLQPLTEDHSWDMFCKKVYNGPCPENLVETSEAILKKCGGLPLAIVAISGVLTTKNQAEPYSWMKVDRSLGAELEDNRRLRSTYKLLALSYNDLPYYLKACFLYMSIFPEDHLIERLKLIRLWMAEGFLTEIKDMAPEDVGQSYLTELINRNLVQVVETSSDGRMKTCHVHDLLREIITVKSRAQNFVAIAKNGEIYPKDVRRLSLQNSLSHFQEDQNLCQLRSLLMFEVEESLTTSSAPSLFSGGLKLLTVLDLQGATLEKFPSSIIELLNLRYLSLKDTRIKSIPNSIGMLQKLQTLDLKHTLISKVPVEILKLQQLRNLLIYRYEFETYADFPSRYGFKAPNGIHNLIHLRRLCSVEGGQGCNRVLRELEALTHLRRLAIIKLSETNGPLLCSSVEKLKNLHALSISAAKDDRLDLQYLRYPPENLRRLYLTGHLKSLPGWIGSLVNLAKIFLKSSRLQVDENPLKHIEDLPNLVHVEFLQVYTGTTLHFKAGKFKKLRILGLHELESLETVIIEETAMSNLERFVIKSCGLLKTLPKGIHNLSILKVLDFINMPGELISTVQLLLTTKGTDSGIIHKIPEVNHIEKVDHIWETRRLNVINMEDENPTKSPHEDPMKNLEDFNKK